MDLKLKRFSWKLKGGFLISFLWFPVAIKSQAEIQKSDSNPFPEALRRIMGLSCFLIRALFLSSLLLLSSSHGGYCYCQLFVFFNVSSTYFPFRESFSVWLSFLIPFLTLYPFNFKDSEGKPWKVLSLKILPLFL